MENTLFLFQNPNSKYPILCAPDDVNGISYKSSPKGWMNSNLFADYFLNTRVINPFTERRTQKLWVDSCLSYFNGQNLSE